MPLKWGDRDEGDTFLGSPEAESYPFHGERCTEWLGGVSQKVTIGEIDLFVLANSRRFFESVRELCEQRQVEATWPNEDPEAPLTICRGDVPMRSLASSASFCTNGRGRNWLQR